MNHSNEIIGVFDEIINEKMCYQLSREHKFIKRSSSKLKGHEFIKVMILPCKGISEDSLKGLCKRIRGFNSEADLSSQALCERINSKASVALIKNVFFRILSYARKKMTMQSPALSKALAGFNTVLIEDSTVCELNEKIDKYESTSRNGTLTSQVKIDLIHELLSGQMVNAELHSGNVPDQALAGRIIKFIKQGDLVIRDLGYFVLRILKEIAEKGAYFVSRSLPNVKIYLNREDESPIDLGDYVRKHYQYDNLIELDVFIGDLKLFVRLILYRAPREVINKRQREANKRSKSTGRNMSKGKKFALEFSVFVTNTTSEILSAEMIGTVYRLRWEIELIFKQWKEQLKIDVLEGINENRIDSLIWGRLCMVVLIGMISNTFGRLAEAIYRELSYVKLIDYLMRGDALSTVVKGNKIEEFMKEIEEDLPRMLLKDLRRLKTMRKRVFEKEDYYGSQVFDLQYVA